MGMHFTLSRSLPLFLLLVVVRSFLERTGKVGELEAECAEGEKEEIMSSVTCKAAASSEGIIWEGSVSMASFPTGCFWTRIEGKSGKRAFYNSHPVGNSNADFGYETIVCKQPGGASGAALGVIALLCCCGIPIVLCGLCGYWFFKNRQLNSQLSIPNSQQAIPNSQMANGNQTQEVVVQAKENPVPANDGPSVIVGKGEETKAMNTETTVAPAALRNAAHSEIVRL